MSEIAIRNARVGTHHDIKPRRWKAAVLQAVERCEACGKRLQPGQHELCPRCDAAAFDALPLATEGVEL